MRLVLKNFRCHTDLDIHIPDSGLVLLSGTSGKGKTTILNALVYVLYGSIRKPYSFGTTTCSVEFDTRSDSKETTTGIESSGTPEIPEIYIKRSNRPNSLFVSYQGEEYNDDVAQGIIDSIFLNRSMFELSCYILQGSENSLLTLPPGEQLSMIENLAMCQENMEEMKSKVKLEIKSRETLKSKIDGKIDILTDIVSRFENKELPDIHINDIESLQAEKTIFETGIKNKEQILKTLRLKKQEASLLDKNKGIAEKAISVYSIRLEEYKARRLELDNNIPRFTTEEDIQKAERDLSKHSKDNKDLSISIRYTELNTIIREFEQSTEDCDIENLEIIKMIRERQDRLFVDSSLIKGYKDTILLYKTLYNRTRDSRSEMLNLYERWRDSVSDSVLKDTNSFIEFVSIKEFHRYITVNSTIDPMKCPCCDTELAILDNTLHLYTNDNKTDYKEYLSILDNLTEIHDRSIKEYSAIDIDNVIKSINKILKDLYLAVKNLPDRDSKFSTCSESIETFLKQYSLYKKIRLDLATSKSMSSMDLYSTISDANTLTSGIDILTSCIDVADILSTSLSTFVSVLESRKEVVKIPDYVKKAKIEIQNITLPSHVKYPEHLNTDALKDRKQTLETTIKELSIEIPRCWEYLSNIQAVESSIRSCIKSIETERCKIPQESLLDSSNSLSVIESDIVKTEMDIDDIKSSLNTTISNIKDVSEYNIRKKEMDEHDNNILQLQQMTESFKELETGIVNLNILESSFKEAQLLAIEYTLTSINTATRQYLDELFEDPIMLNLEIEMESKRPKIVTRIHYKGNEYASINELSGGERQRCHLASILALYDLAGGKILLLDESLNSLDSDINTNTLLMIKERIQSIGLVVVVSHEAVEGVFDTILTI